MEGETDLELDHEMLLGEEELPLGETGFGEEEAALLGEDEFGLQGEEESGLLGEGESALLGEDEFGLQAEDETALLGEDEIYEDQEFPLGEDGEEFLGKLFRGVGRFVKRAAPMLKGVAKIAAPMVGAAVGGPLGGMLGNAAGSLLGEEEYGEDGEDREDEYSAEVGELGPSAQNEVLAEHLAAVASQAQSEEEADAMIGAATVTTLSAADRATLRAMLPHLIRGTAVLTRILRRRRITRPGIRTVPTIVRGTVRVLTRRHAAGQPVNRRIAARVMATQTRRVLSQPRSCALVIGRNARAMRVAVRQGIPVPRRVVVTAGRRRVVR